jgi:hypothetical protein
MRKFSFLLFFCSVLQLAVAQIPVGRDTITVIENGYVLKMPWANGINFSNVSNIDLNGDGKKDLVVFDRLNTYGVGRFRCFIHTGNVGEIKYKEDWYLSYLFPLVTNWAVFKDYNCDGKEDLFCSTNSGIKVYKNTSSNGTLSFQLVKSLILSNYNPVGTPSIANLYASSIGVPGFADIDNDGDLDILTFAPQGTFMEYHKNVSIENNFNCDSLLFEYRDNCWGKMSEGNCGVTFNVCETNRLLARIETPKQSKTYHAGSCLACLDSDGDLDIDLIMGDVVCNTVEYVHNTGVAGVAAFTDSTKLYPNYPNKNNTTIAKMNSFPCAYNVDVNGDNKKDLIVTPNAYGTENYKSVWLYKNTSTTNTVNFQFEKNNFLQDEMIEVGQNSYPVLFDYDADGDKDLLIGNYGYYNNTSMNARLTLYKNIGNNSQPTYSLITRDYCSLSTLLLNSSFPVNHVMPSIGDIDQDGDEDLIFGTSGGQIHWFENTAGANTLCNFSIFHENPFSFTTPSSGAAPQLFDLDLDGRLDLLIGMQNGKIAWYKNTGTTAAPVFSLITANLGGVDVKGDPNLYGYEGYATPFFYRGNGTTYLLVGSFSGAISHFSVPTTVTDPFILITQKINGYNEGSQSTVWFEDVNGDNKRDLFIGNGGGGLNFFSSKSLTIGFEELNAPELSSKISLFPNPTQGNLQIQIDLVNFQKASVIVYDLIGKSVLQQKLASTSETLDISGLEKGVYFASFFITTNLQTKTVTKKIIKE